MDWNSEAGQKLAERLRKELVIWLTTVRPDGTPMPTPVWFIWEGETVLIFSQPNTFKLRNLAANSKASLNLNSDEWGGEVVVFSGTVTVEKGAPLASESDAYIDKYREEIKNLQMAPENFARDYSVMLRFHIQHIRA